MNSDIRDLAKWATSQGWTVTDTASGYTQFFDTNGVYVGEYPATPSNPRRRMADLSVALRKAGLQVPPPSKKELRSARNKQKGQGK